MVILLIQTSKQIIMNTHFLKIAPILLVCLFFLSACGMLSSEKKQRIEIEIDSEILTENNEITSKIINHTDDVILIFQDTRRSQLQRKSADGEWKRLHFRQIDDGEGIPYSDWYISLEPGGHHEFVLRIDLMVLEDSSQQVSGEYRFIYELYNTDHQFKRNLYSRSFSVDVEL